MWFELTSGFFYACGFAPVFCLCYAAMKLAEDRYRQPTERDMFDLETESYDRGFQDGKDDQVRSEVLRILDESIDRKLSELASRRMEKTEV
ncbi:hypothetical protein [Planctomicrobium sp. SH527]|uniref:hypothetical protein n=1 Tax=Planctomicrobium sp. SH527 TaxID=3448123 RepID=UPI003F5B7502